jgi:hypothetical protein
MLSPTPLTHAEPPNTTLAILPFCVQVSGLCSSVMVVHCTPFTGQLEGIRPRGRSSTAASAYSWQKQTHQQQQQQTHSNTANSCNKLMPQQQRQQQVGSTRSWMLATAQPWV